MEAHEHTTALLNASIQRKDAGAKRVVDELATKDAELITASASYNSVAGERNQSREDCSEYKGTVDAYVQQLDQLRVEVDRLERQAHGQEQKYASASQADGQISNQVSQLTHEVEVLMAKQRDADQRAASNTQDIRQLTNSVDNYAHKLISAEATLAQTRDE